MALQTQLNIREINFERQKVFLRLDLNVPVKEGKILDFSRIEAVLPTLEYLLSKGARLVVASHLGRPQKKSKEQKAFSMEPVARVLNEKGFEVLLMESPDSEAPMELLKGLSGKQIIMLENLRFHEGESSNSRELAGKWAKYTDVYVNDAFGVCHRTHASINALPLQIPKRCYGFLIERELECLRKLKDEPVPPFVLITGGGKLSDKMPLLESLSNKADSLVIGGAMSYTFLKALGYSTGASLIEENFLSRAERFLKQMETAGKKVCLPTDHIVVENLESGDWKTSSGPNLSPLEMAVDIGPKTCLHFKTALKEAGCIFWNGPMGIYEKKPFDRGSRFIAKVLGESSAFTVIGGGDSIAVAKDLGLSSKQMDKQMDFFSSLDENDPEDHSSEKLEVDHISTGGGASLQFIQGQALPGLEVLKLR